MEQQNSSEVVKLTTNVKTVACVQFALTVVIQVFLSIGMLATPENIIPANYSEFVHDCHDPQSAMRSICGAWEQNCEQKHLRLDHCNDDGGYDKFRNACSLAMRGAAIIAIAVGLCCAACVPACGFFGARDKNTCLLCVYIVFNVLSIVSYVYQMTWSFNLMGGILAMVKMVMPAINTYFACRLKQMISDPVQQAPLMQNPSTQTTMPQPPVVAQAYVVNPAAAQPPTAQLQAFQGAT